MTQPTLMPAGGHWAAIVASDTPDPATGKRRERTLQVVGWERGRDAVTDSPALWSWLLHGSLLMRSDALEGYHVVRYKDVTPECGCQSGE